MFWVSQAVQVGALASAAYTTGKLVELRDWKVNYMRKVNFFAIFLVQLALRGVFHYHHTLAHADDQAPDRRRDVRGPRRADPASGARVRDDVPLLRPAGGSPATRCSG